MTTQALLVFTTLPDRSAADFIARRLVEDRCAACVTVGAPVHSLYHWEGKTETATEIPLLIKTTVAAYDTLEALLRSLHPYELPEILAVPVTTGFAPYLDSIAAGTVRSEVPKNVT